MEKNAMFSEKFWVGSIIALMLAVSLAGIANHELWTPDEPREAAISLSMSRTGNLIIPELAGKAFVEKPPLFYITASFFLLLLGKIIGNTFALRLVSACFGLGTLLFTYLLGEIYFSRKKALIAAGMLATMIGFVHVSHWLLVDNALMFFIVISVWALAQAYERGRFSYLPLAGLFAAGAFLTKGVIGPIIILIAWLGLIAGWVCGKTETFPPKGGSAKTDNTQLPTSNIGPPHFPSNLDVQSWMFNVSCIISRLLIKKILAFHLLGLTIAVTISAAWIIAFAVKGGPELFREWWWNNHFGRFTGQSINLGHIAPWYYYLEILPVYVLPWIVPLIISLTVLFKKIFRRESPPAGAALLLFWFLGTFLLLSLSATKRDIYLCLLLPPCALLCVQGLEDFGARFARYQNLIIATATAWAILLIIACPIIDRTKNYAPAFRKTSSFIISRPDLRPAGFDLDETTLAGLYYYCGLTLPPAPDRQTMEKILQGRDQEHNAVLVLKKNDGAISLSGETNQVIFEARMGKRRLLQILAAPDGKSPDQNKL